VKRTHKVKICATAGNVGEVGLDPGKKKKNQMAYEKVGQELVFYLINISLFCQLRAQQVFMTLVG